MHNPNIQMLEVVADGLKSLREDVVFVGGTTTAFYIDDPAAPDARPTNDVDCIIEIGSSLEFYKLEEELRRLGFKNTAVDKAPLCRWNYCGLIVDIMPSDGSILGFFNRWYTEGIAHKISVPLPSKVNIYILSLPYFLATKMEAYRGRGQNDPRMSRDIEDVFSVLDGHVKIEEVLTKVSGELAAYLKDAFVELVQNEFYEDAIVAHLPSGPDRQKRKDKILKMVASFVS